MDLSFKIIIALLGSGALSSFITAIVSRKLSAAQAKKVEAEGMAAKGGAWDKLIDQLQEELQNVKLDLAGLQRENINMYKHIAQLEAEKIHMQAQIKELETKLSVYKQKEATGS